MAILRWWGADSCLQLSPGAMVVACRHLVVWRDLEVDRMEARSELGEVRGFAGICGSWWMTHKLLTDSSASEGKVGMQSSQFMYAIDLRRLNINLTQVVLALQAQGAPKP
jgi:hypothetical protein